MVIRNNTFVWIIGAFFYVLLGCREQLTPERYLQTMMDTSRGPIVTLVNGSYTYELQHRFPIHEALISFRGESVSLDSLNSRQKLFETDWKFKLRIYPSEKDQELLKKGTQSEGDYYNRIRYFSSEIANDLGLVAGEDTLYTVNTLFERSYGLTPYVDVLMAFPKEDGKAPKHLIFKDRILSGSMLTFDVDQITDESNYPKLKI